MTTLPACLPVAVAVCMAAAAVFAVGVPVCGWIDWRERRRQRHGEPLNPGTPRAQPPKRSINFLNTRKDHP